MKCETVVCTDHLYLRWGHSLLPPDCSKLFLRIFFAGFLIFSSWKREAGSGVNSCSKYWVVHFPFELKVSIHWKELQASRGRYHLLFWQNPASKKGCGSDPYALSCNWRIEHHKGLSLCPACPIDSSSSQLILSSSMATRPVDRLSNSGQLTSKGLLIANQACNCWSVSLSFFLLLCDISMLYRGSLCFDPVRSVCLIHDGSYLSKMFSQTPLHLTILSVLDS